MIKRSHKQNCSLAYAADILSERWTLLIIRELLIKPCRYGELLENLIGMGTNLLATRLKELSELQLIEKQHSRYQLTQLGQSLEPSVLGLIRWGLQFSQTLSDPNYLHRQEWDLLALKALFNPARSDAIKLCMQVDLKAAAKSKIDEPIKKPKKSTKTTQRVWIIIQNNQFSFQFDKPSLAIDIHWQNELSKLAHHQPETLLSNATESNALKQLLSTFDPIG